MSKKFDYLKDRASDEYHEHVPKKKRVMFWLVVAFAMGFIGVTIYNLFFNT